MKLRKNNLLLLLLALSLVPCPLSLSCSFDYGDLDSADDSIPNLIMENVDYVRVRSADPVARFQADRAERYEKRNLMKLENLTFEQFGSSLKEVNAVGTAGNAVIETDSSNILMDNGVRIEVESEDIIIETQMLEWNDEQRTLSAKEEEVFITMNNGTSFTGIGFFANARNRTWEFTDSVGGEYIFEDDEEGEDVDVDVVNLEETEESEKDNNNEN